VNDDKDKPRATCPVCFGTYALRAKAGAMVVVLHGYRRPGTGELRGQCPGVGFAPWEVSKAGAEAYLATIDDHEARAVDALSATETSDRIVVWTYERSGDAYRPTTITLDGVVTVDETGPGVPYRQARQARSAKAGLVAWQRVHVDTVAKAAKVAQRRKATEVTEAQAVVDFWRSERVRMGDAIKAWVPRSLE